MATETNLTLSEELKFRGFMAETTVKDPRSLDTRADKQFYWGADPSADSLTIGNLAALLMCACFVKHGYKPYLLVGGATGQIGDPKENGERDLKPLEEIEHNKKCIKTQIERVMRNYLELCQAGEGKTFFSDVLPANEKMYIPDGPDGFARRAVPPAVQCMAARRSERNQKASFLVSEQGGVEGRRPTFSSETGAEKKVFASPATELVMVDNYDWFKEIKFLDFLRTVGKAFSMTQLLDRKFIQNRIGEGGSGISYAEFSYTLIQGYDFYHLYREYGVSLQLCGADQFGNCSSGIHLIKRLENAEADVWSTPLVIDPASGRKFGKSEGNAIWLASEGPNSTTVFDFYQFWLNQPDDSVEYLMKFYTIYSPDEIENILEEHRKSPEKRLAGKALAKSVTELVHGREKAAAAIRATEKLFDKSYRPTPEDAEDFAGVFPTFERGNVLEVLADSGLAASKSDARKLVKAGAISLNGEKITDDTAELKTAGILKKGKNKFIIIK
ncbi:tyrosine--tRNA ligase [Candidatus Saccharibacteria bacterium]|nr:tyrosine--tRNA ligase [Candidatus Saccharibacteria bacterium]